MRKKLTLLFALFCLFGGNIWAQTTFVQGNLSYTVIDEGAKAVSVAKADNNISGDIVIPSSVTYQNVTYSVTTISATGFQNTALTAITIPASVEEIGYYAFQGTSKMAKVTIQDSATPIEFVTGYYRSFGDAAKEVYIGRDIERTGDYAGDRMFNNVEKATFGPKVTTIGNNLLSDQDNMHTLVIGDGVKIIGADAFKGDRYGSPELTVTMGANVEHIGARAFQGCFALKSITLPSTLKTIGTSAFDGTYITAITIPASVTDIEYYAFVSCGQLTSINFEDCDEPVNFVTGYYRSFGDAAKEVYIGRDINRTGDYTGERMFNNVRKVTFGPKVTEIGQKMFYDNSELASIYIGSGVKTISQSAFYNCGTSADVEELKVTMGANVDLLDEYAFQSCSKLKSITIPTKLKAIGKQAFQNCGLTAITIPANITFIDYYAFQGCNSLASINIEGSNEPLEFVTGYNRSFGDTPKTVFYGRNVVRTGDYYNDRFFNKVTDLTIGDLVTEIPNSAFDGNYELQNITMGEGVKSIGEAAFRNCGTAENVTELKVELGTNVDSLAAYAFQNCKTLKTISLPSKLTVIDSYAFESSGLTALTIPASVKRLGYYAFRSCGSLASINIEESNEPIEFATGYNRSFGDTPKTVFYGRNVVRTGDYYNDRMFNKVTDLTIGDLVTEIPNRMFDGNIELQNVTIGSGVKYIGEAAFYNCGTSTDITEMKVEMGANVDSLAAYAFQSCKTLKAISLPSTLTVIESYAFESSGLTALTIPASVKRLGYYAFRSCGSLASINIEESNEPIEFATGYNRSFGDTPKTVFYGRNVVRTGDYYNDRMFNKVTDLTIGDMVTEIPNNMFNGNNELKNVTIGTGVKFIGQSAFYNCGTSDDVTEMKVEMGANVDSLAAYAFQSCKTLKAISLPSTLTVIESYAFENSGLTELFIPASVKRLGYYAFLNCNSLASINFEESNEPIEVVTGYSRSFGSAAKEVFMGRNIVRTGDYTNERIFNNLTKLTVGDKVTEIGSNMFNGNNELKEVYVPWTQPININANVFNNTTYQTATLFVPGGTVDAYKADAVWSKFLNIQAGSYFVTGTATAGGKMKFENITVSGDSKTLLVIRETDVTFEMVPDENYDFTSLTVNNEAVPVENNTYTYANLLQDINVVATFTEKPKFDVKATATGGTVSLNGETPSASQTINVYRDTDVTLTIAAAEGYENPKVTVNGTDVTAQLKENQLTIANIQEAQTIVVTFTKIKFQIATEPTQNGTIELSKDVVEWGDDFTATFKPATGYEFATATLNGQDVTSQVQDGVLTVTNVKENKTIGATFAKQTFSVSISGGGVTVSTTTPQYGDNVTVFIDDDPDRTLVSLIVNGQDVTSQVQDGQYVINNVTGNVTIEATFKSTKEFITLTGEYATFSCPENLNFTGSDLRAYIASGFNKNTNQVLLVRVYDVPAGTGVFLVGEPGTTYKIPYAESESYYVNLFLPNLQKSTIYATTGDFSNYTFGEQDGDSGFYPIVDYVTLLAQTAYLQLPSSFVSAGVKVSVVFEDDVIDGIEDFRISESDAVIFDLAGRRLGKSQKGINIVNGKKVLVK